MAPVIEGETGMMKRDVCGYGWYLGRDGYCHAYSGWYWWGRWVFAGLAILFVILVFLLLFRNSRRRRRQGQQPLYGTGWMAPAPPYYPPPPQYTPQDNNPLPPGYKPNQNDGYYGQQQEGIQLQPPASAYHRATDNTDYAPPPGPPPNATKPN
ncbi:hypothetical protein N656DRAFT_794650 [Canariomyces notabilis]|uniref:Chitin synthesis regulation, Congo red resistance, RCR protein n=1 Tax=Canariomyces notabilis TaxID=2074819 RepID=A0AAN6YW69_9PEZI|nr:hypothetical protein N656DRAFT_794650 [Canariomyces arenarius]